MPDIHIFDIEGYCQRIGYSGPVAPTLDVLRELAFHHARAIPFENLDVLLGKGISLDPAALEEKLVHQKRGGYCFEQNGLMLGILQQIGFDVTPLAGRVRLDVSRDTLPPRTHLFLKVKLDQGDWFFDVGVGGFSLTTPIQHLTDAEQWTRHETRRLVKSSDRYFHQAWVQNTWIDVYEFTGEPMPAVDREVSNWWTSSNPKSKFANNLFCARSGEDGERFGLNNNRLVRRRGPRVIEEKIIESGEELLSVLDTTFGLSFEPGTRFGTGDRPWPTQ